MDIPFDLFDKDRPPAPEAATPEDIEQYNRQYIEHNGPPEADTSGPVDPEQSFYAKQETDMDTAKHKAEFPWLWDPSRGRRWDFNPISLRNLAQQNTWVGMLTQSITKEIAETPFTVVETEDRVETQKRLNTHPEQRTPLSKADLPDRTAERIYDLLQDPNPDDNWQDLVEMWLGDLLEIGSMTAVKAYPRSAYDGDDFIADPGTVEPHAILPSAPEVWTKDYQGKTGLLEGYWQFDDHKSPGVGSTEGRNARSRGISDPVFFDKDELIWDDMTPRTNRGYGMPPTLLVEDFLQSLDLAITQEQEYLSRGSIPSGAWIFENWDREQLKERKQEMMENVKGKPHKSLMFAGQQGDVRFEPMSMNFNELEFTDRMKWYARVVASEFQVPTAVVGIEPERVNYNTFQGERENFESNTLGPYMQSLERVINDQLIKPHWDGYRFEFKPGMSESTRKMISERVSREFNAGLIRRNEARREIGREPVDEDFDGFQDEVVEDTSADDAQDALGDLVAERMDKGNSLGKAEYEVGGETIEISPPDYMVSAAEAADEAQNKGWIPDDCGGEAGRGTQRKNEVLNNEVGPGVVDEMAAYLTSHEEDVTAEGHPRDWTEGEWGDCGNAQYAKWAGVGDGRAKEWAQERSDRAAELRGEEPTYKQYTGGSGNANSAVEKDEPLRSTDEWYLFDVQPEMVESLQQDIADDVADIYDSVLNDDRIMDIIERLAGDETEKSISELSRRLRELFDESDVVQRIERELSEGTAEGVREGLEGALEATDETPDVDIDAIEEQLADRAVEFADSFADRISEDIRDAVGDGWAEGKSSREIARDLAEQRDISQGWAGAERIARQEMQIASGRAREAVGEQLDKVRVWDTAGDNRVRDAHQDMQGKWARPGENFVVEYPDRGTQKEDVPGASEPGIGCRCVQLLRDRSEVDDNDYAGDTGL